MRCRTIIYLSLVFLLCFCRVNAQTNIAGILQKITSAPDDTNKINLYKEAIAYYKRVDMDSAYTLAQDGLKLAEKLSAKGAQAFMLLQKGGLDREQGRLGLASINLTDALDIYTQLNERRFAALATNELGVVNGIRGNYTAATEMFLKALKIFESLADTQGLGQTYIKLGVINEKMNNLDKAMSVYRNALSLSKAKHDSVNVAYIYNNMGIVEGKAENNEATFRYFDSALSLCVSPKFNNVKISILLNSGIAYARAGDEQRALEQFRLGLAMARKNNMPFDIPNLLLNIALLDKVVQQEQKVPLLQEALFKAKELGDESLQVNIYQTLAEVMAESGDYKQAFYYQDTSDQMEKSLYSMQKNTEIANLQALHELDRSKSKVFELEQLNAQRVRERTAVIIISIVLLTLLFYVTYTYRKTRMLNERLAAHREELAAANSVKDKIFSIIGHDLRAPVSTLLGMLNILVHENEKMTNEERKEIYTSLQEQGNVSLDTLNKLLLWGSRQIKGISLQVEQFDLKDVVESNIKLLAENAAAKRIAIVNLITEKALVHADISQIDFVIRNLLFNALKYTRDGGEIELGPCPYTGGDEACFYVKDNGIGMSAETLTSIFELKGNSRPGTNNERGTGLGLLLCKGFLEQNGGKIWVESEEGKGSKFYFTLKTKQ